MQHYYFDFKAGSRVIADEIGLDFATPEEGRAAALIALSEVFAQELEPDAPAGATVTMRGDRQVVYSAAISLTETWFIPDRE